MDDLVLLPILVTATVKLIPPAVMERCRESARDMWQSGKPKKWYYALPIVAEWVLIAAVIAKAVWI